MSKPQHPKNIAKICDCGTPFVTSADDPGDKCVTCMDERESWMK